jgi:hypothetical protein
LSLLFVSGSLSKMMTSPRWPNFLERGETMHPWSMGQWSQFLALRDCTRHDWPKKR